MDKVKTRQALLRGEFKSLPNTAEGQDKRLELCKQLVKTEPFLVVEFCTGEDRAFKIIRYCAIINCFKYLDPLLTSEFSKSEISKLLIDIRQDQHPDMLGVCGLICQDLSRTSCKSLIIETLEWAIKSIESGLNENNVSKWVWLCEIYADNLLVVDVTKLEGFLTDVFKKLRELPNNRTVQSSTARVKGLLLSCKLAKIAQGGALGKTIASTTEPIPEGFEMTEFNYLSSPIRPTFNYLTDLEYEMVTIKEKIKTPKRENYSKQFLYDMHSILSTFSFKFSAVLFFISKGLEMDFGIYLDYLTLVLVYSRPLTVDDLSHLDDDLQALCGSIEIPFENWEERVSGKLYQTFLEQLFIYKRYEKFIFLYEKGLVESNEKLDLYYSMVCFLKEATSDHLNAVVRRLTKCPDATCALLLSSILESYDCPNIKSLLHGILLNTRDLKHLALTGAKIAKTFELNGSISHAVTLLKSTIEWLEYQRSQNDSLSCYSITCDLSLHKRSGPFTSLEDACIHVDLMAAYYRCYLLDRQEKNQKLFEEKRLQYYRLCKKELEPPVTDDTPNEDDLLAICGADPIKRALYYISLVIHGQVDKASILEKADKLLRKAHEIEGQMLKHSIYRSMNSIVTFKQVHCQKGGKSVDGTLFSSLSVLHSLEKETLYQLSLDKPIGVVTTLPLPLPLVWSYLACQSLKYFHIKDHFIKGTELNQVSLQHSHRSIIRVFVSNLISDIHLKHSKQLSKNQEYQMETIHKYLLAAKLAFRFNDERAASLCCTKVISILYPWLFYKVQLSWVTDVLFDLHSILSASTLNLGVKVYQDFYALISIYLLKRLGDGKDYTRLLTAHQNINSIVKKGWANDLRVATSVQVENSIGYIFKPPKNRGNHTNFHYFTEFDFHAKASIKNEIYQPQKPLNVFLDYADLLVAFYSELVNKEDDSGKPTLLSKRNLDFQASLKDNYAIFMTAGPEVVIQELSKYKKNPRYVELMTRLIEWCVVRGSYDNAVTIATEMEDWLDKRIQTIYLIDVLSDENETTKETLVKRRKYSMFDDKKQIALNWLKSLKQKAAPPKKTKKKEQADGSTEQTVKSDTAFVKKKKEEEEEEALVSSLNSKQNTRPVSANVPTAKENKQEAEALKKAKQKQKQLYYASLSIDERESIESAVHRFDYILVRLWHRSHYRQRVTTLLTMEAPWRCQMAYLKGKSAFEAFKLKALQDPTEKDDEWLEFYTTGNVQEFTGKSTMNLDFIQSLAQSCVLSVRFGVYSTIIKTSHQLYSCLRFLARYNKTPWKPHCQRALYVISDALLDVLSKVEFGEPAVKFTHGTQTKTLKECSYHELMMGNFKLEWQENVKHSLPLKLGPIIHILLVTVESLFLSKRTHRLHTLISRIQFLLGDTLNPWFDALHAPKPMKLIADYLQIGQEDRYTHLQHTVDTFETLAEKDPMYYSVVGDLLQEMDHSASSVFWSKCIDGLLQKKKVLLHLPIQVSLSVESSWLVGKCATQVARHFYYNHLDKQYAVIEFATQCFMSFIQNNLHQVKDWKEWVDFQGPLPVSFSEKLLLNPPVLFDLLNWLGEQLYVYEEYAQSIILSSLSIYIGKHILKISTEQVEMKRSLSILKIDANFTLLDHPITNVAKQLHLFTENYSLGPLFKDGERVLETSLPLMELPVASTLDANYTKSLEITSKTLDQFIWIARLLEAKRNYSMAIKYYKSILCFMETLPETIRSGLGYQLQLELHLSIVKCLFSENQPIAVTFAKQGLELASSLHSTLYTTEFSLLLNLMCGIEFDKKTLNSHRCHRLNQYLNIGSFKENCLDKSPKDAINWLLQCQLPLVYKVQMLCRFSEKGQVDLDTLDYILQQLSSMGSHDVESILKVCDLYLVNKLDKNILNTAASVTNRLIALKNMAGPVELPDKIKKDIHEWINFEAETIQLFTAPTATEFGNLRWEDVASYRAYLYQYQPSDYYTSRDMVMYAKRQDLGEFLKQHDWYQLQIIEKPIFWVSPSKLAISMITDIICHQVTAEQIHSCQEKLKEIIRLFNHFDITKDASYEQSAQELWKQLIATVSSFIEFNFIEPTLKNALLLSMLLQGQVTQ